MTTVEAPLGLLLLGVLGLVVIGFATTMAWWQARVLMDTRRHTKELQTQRELADRAEASRFTELQQRLDVDFAAVKGELQQQANSLAAAVAELEDRIERRGVR